MKPPIDSEISIFARKPIEDLQPPGSDARSLKRVLGAGDLVMLGIGAVIGAGIFGAIGTAAAGQTGPDGEVVRYGAGPALVLSFILLGGACALAALCYAELAAMIPQAGSAYAYTYATLGERIPYVTTLVTGIIVAAASLVGDAAETYDLTNIGTLFAFTLVCAGVLVLRISEPDRPRPFKVPAVWVIAPLGVAACLFVMVGLPRQAWERFGIWLVIGAAVYALYGYSHSSLRRVHGA